MVINKIDLLPHDFSEVIVGVHLKSASIYLSIYLSIYMCILIPTLGARASVGEGGHAAEGSRGGTRCAAAKQQDDNRHQRGAQEHTGV